MEIGPDELWSATSTVKPLVLDRVVYGRLPDGFRQLSARVQLLTVGCYVAELDAADGLTNPEADKRSRSMCARGAPTLEVSFAAYLTR